MITTKQRSKLKSLANNLKPLVTIGKDELTDNVVAEIATALYHNELVKVASLKTCTIPARAMCQEVCDILGAEPVLCVGNRFVIYKRSDKKEIEHIRGIDLGNKLERNIPDIYIIQSCLYWHIVTHQFDKS